MKKSEKMKLFKMNIRDLLQETGEMTRDDIDKGGEHYEWAMGIKKEVLKIQKLTNNKLKFVEMRPFDAYQGPYAIVNVYGKTDKIWSVNLNMLFLEGEQWIGDAVLIAKGINAKSILMQLERNYKSSQ